VDSSALKRFEAMTRRSSFHPSCISHSSILRRAPTPSVGDPVLCIHPATATYHHIHFVPCNCHRLHIRNLRSRTSASTFIPNFERTIPERSHTPNRRFGAQLNVDPSKPWYGGIPKAHLGLLATKPGSISQLPPSWSFLSNLRCHRGFLSTTTPSLSVAQLHIAPFRVQIPQSRPKIFLSPPGHDFVRSSIICTYHSVI